MESDLPISLARLERPKTALRRQIGTHSAMSIVGNDGTTQVDDGSFVVVVPRTVIDHRLRHPADVEELNKRAVCAQDEDLYHGATGGQVATR